MRLLKTCKSSFAFIIESVNFKELLKEGNKFSAILSVVLWSKVRYRKFKLTQTINLQSIIFQLYVTKYEP